MGYFLTTEPENAAPGKSCPMPKTHTPGSPVKERGFRFYMPENGRWGSRDPSEELGGINIVLFAGNNPICQSDLLGLKWYGVSYQSGAAINGDGFVQAMKNMGGNSTCSSGIWWEQGNRMPTTALSSTNDCTCSSRSKYTCKVTLAKELSGYAVIRMGTWVGLTTKPQRDQEFWSAWWIIVHTHEMGHANITEGVVKSVGEKTFSREASNCDGGLACLQALMDVEADFNIEIQLLRGMLNVQQDLYQNAEAAKFAGYYRAYEDAYNTGGTPPSSGNNP